MTKSFAPIALAKLERDARMKRLHRRLATLSILYLATIGLATIGLATAARAYDIAPVSDPETLGFSPARLARIPAWQQTQVDAGAFSGAVTAIARNGKVAYLQAVGFRDRAKTIPLQSNAIFWIASMTKPVTSVAAMMLVEEGQLDLAAPVSQYLPEFKGTTVAVETRDAATGKSDITYEPQKRPMIVEDLLRHTAGMIHGVGKAKVDQLYHKHLYDKAGVFHRDRTLADVVSELATLPLAHQPGEVWDYSHSVDVLGRVIEVVSGQPLDQFLEARLFKPDAAQRRRARRHPHPLARNYQANDDERTAVRHPLRRLCQRRRRPPRGLDLGTRLCRAQRCRVEFGARVSWQL
jgi:CubicO group peptidase (beta-lactamase class C family)